MNGTVQAMSSAGIHDGQPREVVVVFGGRSAEHDVSCVSAAYVWSAAVAAGHTVRGLGIDRDGAWRAVTATDVTTAGAALAVDGPPVTVNELTSCERDSAVVIPVLHGPFGEDGTIQGLCEMLDLAYTGAGVLGSAVCMDKAMAKTVLAASKIPQTPHVAVTAQTPTNQLHATAEQLGFPLFVKPANMGSSIGVRKVDDEHSLLEAVAHALLFDETALVERAVRGREIEIAVLGRENTLISEPGEIHAAAEFYDYNDKYVDGRSSTTVPAPLDTETHQRLRALAYEVTGLLRCREMARCDVFVTEERDILVNEVNTIPGFTPISMYPRMLAASGVTPTDTINRLIADAVDRRHQRYQRPSAPI